MKKILWFSLSLGLSVLAFFAVVAVCLFLSGAFDNEDEKMPTAPHRNDGFVLNVSVIFADDPADKVFASVLTLDGFNKTATAKEIDCESTLENGKTLSEIYKTEGLYPFDDTVKRHFSPNSIGFIKLNSNTFVTITDRLKNIVYNDEDNRMLVTGVMALNSLDGDSFSQFCQTAATGVLCSDIKEEYLFLTRICETDLSYPILYDIVRGN